MEEENNSKSSRAGPMLDPDSDSLDFKSWYERMASHINGKSDVFNLLADLPPPAPDPNVVIGRIQNAQQRRAAEEEKALYDKYVYAQKRGASSLLECVSRNQNATNLLMVQRREVAGLVLRLGENLPVADMLENLRVHYDP